MFLEIVFKSWFIKKLYLDIWRLVLKNYKSTFPLSNDMSAPPLMKGGGGGESK
jgi:hypothetical protein